MAFLQAQPSLALRPFIASYWAYQGQPDVLEDFTYPDGCQEIVFNVETEVAKKDHAGNLSSNPGIEVIGQLTRPYRVRARGSQLYFGVRFYPHGFSAFSPGIWELKDQNVDARDIFSADIQSLCAYCQHIDAFPHFVQQTDSYFTRKASHIGTQRKPYNLVSTCIQTLRTAEYEFGIADLCARYSVSPRWLQMQFKNYVGISPKTLQKIFRFHSSLRLLHEGTESLTAVAATCGYYDQAHFNREFKAFSGVTPRVYGARSHPINRHFYAAVSSN